MDKNTLARIWPYLVTVVMVAYVIVLAVMVKADVAETSDLLRLLGPK